MAKKTGKNYSHLFINLMYSASIILFLLFMFFVRQDMLAYDPMQDGASMEAAAYIRAVEFIIPGIILMILAARKSHKEKGE